MKSRYGFAFALILLSSIALKAQKDKWIYLFDGKSVKNLRGYMMDSFPTQAWKVENAALEAKTGVPNIDFLTRDTYKNFELSMDWAVSKAGNSGVFYYVVEKSTHQSGNGNSPNWLDNYEMQILDDIDFNDKAPIRSAGSVYDLIIPKGKVLKPVGQFNNAKLIVNHGHVEHWLNGVKIVEYDFGSDAMKKLISESKFKDNPNFAKSTDGHIMFQHHGQQVWFKNIKIRVIK
jgi:Domain of Unknown Function (DUF1080)